jgi:hypothetical protein
VAAFRNEIWSVVEQANEYAPSHSRIFKEMILISPKHKQFALTPKQGISRPNTLKLYEQEIDAIYETVQNAASSTVRAPESFNSDSTLRYVRATVSEVMDKTVEFDKDLFEQGCDSLQATFIRSRLSTALRRVNPKATLPGNWVYENTTIALLTESFLKHIESSAERITTVDRQAEIDKMERHVKLYIEDLPKHTGTKTLPEKTTVLVSGTTGTLGTYLLNE